MKAGAAALFILSALLASAARSQPTAECPIVTDWSQMGDGNKALILPGRLGGQQLNILIDSGVETSTLDRSLSPLVRTNPMGASAASAYGGSIAVARADNVTMVIAGREVVLREIGVTDFSQINRTNARINAIVGRDILKDCSIELDSDDSRFRILAPNPNPIRARSQAIVPIAYDGGLPEVQVGLGSDRAKALIDTGNEAEWLTDAGTWSILLHPGIRETSVITLGLGGINAQGLAILPSFLVGAFRIDNVEARIQPYQTGARPQIGVGVIGVGLLKRANIVIDFRDRYLLLWPRRTPAPAPDRSTSGVLAILSGDRLRIVHIMLNSPAAAAGLTDKDQICRIDGQAIPGNYAVSPIRIWSKDKPGRIVDLTLCDGRSKRLKLGFFY